MRILKVTEYSIEFDNGKEITFEQLDSLYKAVCKWMYEREEERKTEDRLDAKETRNAVMIAGGRGGVEKARMAKTRQERNKDT